MEGRTAKNTRCGIRKVLGNRVIMRLLALENEEKLKNHTKFKASDCPNYEAIKYLEKGNLKAEDLISKIMNPKFN